MSGIIIREKFITRKMVQEYRNKAFFVFGDNILRQGFGGQAKEMRGEPNVIGIPTKWKPTTSSTAYFSDSDYDFIGVRLAIDNAFTMIEKVLEAGFNIYIPLDGIGTGRAKLNVTAPIIFKIIEDKIKELEQIYNV